MAVARNNLNECFETKITHWFPRGFRNKGKSLLIFEKCYKSDKHRSVVVEAYEATINENTKIFVNDKLQKHVGQLKLFLSLFTPYDIEEFHYIVPNVSHPKALIGKRLHISNIYLKLNEIDYDDLI